MRKNKKKFPKNETKSTLAYRYGVEEEKNKKIFPKMSQNGISIPYMK
ncbi:hypothetical protein BN188_700015 [Clostridioides difficile T19]|nr:hypothetical protein BN188_700015 [Clostridioides difficile T19]